MQLTCFFPRGQRKYSFHPDNGNYIFQQGLASLRRVAVALFSKTKIQSAGRALKLTTILMEMMDFEVTEASVTVALKSA